MRLSRILKSIQALPFFIGVRNANRRAFSSKYLLYTNVAISMTLSAAGDMMEQHYQILFGEMTNYDTRRSVKMVSEKSNSSSPWPCQLTTHLLQGCSGITVGVACHYWYKFIDRRIPGRTIGLVLRKVFWDQVIGSPINISVLFITLGFLERRNLAEIGKEMKDKFIRLYTAEWIVWPPAQIINFYWLPNRYRVLYDNTISLGYDIYTSRVANE